MKLWKRNAVVAAIVLFVCMAVYLNWSYNQEPTEMVDTGKVLGEAALMGSQQGSGQVLTGDDVKIGEGMTASGSDYFASARLNRQQARDSALSILQETLNSENAQESSKTEAGAAIETMAAAALSEAQIENLVVAKGYADCVAFIGEDSLSLAVAVPEGGLTEADTAKIVDVVNQTAGFTAGQIKIIEVE